ncbi:MAG: Rhomboid family protein [Solirubrobacterales bacterium]|jgi:membrane associated rhomboid family serine protease|nr:Rhomboid family protein [Solirubrobacterales bacterium]
MATQTQTCYRHPSRETGVSCSNCGRPICPSCMTPTPVGMRCPECSKQKTEVRTLASLHANPTVTMALIAINVVAFLASGQFGVGSSATSNQVFANGALFGPLIDQDSEYWRLVTSGFLHAGFIHIAFNMYLLYTLGNMLEPALGNVKFALIYAVGLLGGSFGALLVEPTAVTVGASGAIFGLMGAAFFELRSRGIDPFASGIGGLILLNLAFSFILSNISIGGHIGGLIGGSLAMLAWHEADKRRQPLLGYAAMALLAVLAVGGAIAVAGRSTGIAG